jgi:ABC-type multidrug transport system ATPase subunit
MTGTAAKSDPTLAPSAAAVESTTLRTATNKGVAVSVRNLAKVYPVPLLRLKRVFRRKTKEPVEALRDVSFEIREGEVFGIIGRNGAGKTTLAKIIATLVQPTSGGVTVRGFDSVRDEERCARRSGSRAPRSAASTGV